MYSKMHVERDINDILFIFRNFVIVLDWVEIIPRAVKAVCEIVTEWGVYPLKKCQSLMISQNKVHKKFLYVLKISFCYCVPKTSL